MKTKSFLLFSTSVFAISLFLIVFHSQPPQSIQSIVSQTHQHIKDFQENLRDVEENHLVEEEQYSRLLGLDGHAEQWHNTTLPAIVTYARGDAHAPAVGFVRAATHLPYTVLVYNLGLKPYSLAVVSNNCNSSKCAIIDFDLDAFPSHVADESIHAFRPLIIQHALSRVGGVIFCESSQRWAGTAAELGALWGRGRAGLAAPRRRHVAHAPAHVPLPARQLGRLPVRADGGCDAPRRRQQARGARRHAHVDTVRAHTRLHHAPWRAVRRVQVRQEAAVPVLGVPRAGRVRAEHHPGRAVRLRGGAVRRARASAAVAPRRRRARRRHQRQRQHQHQRQHARCQRRRRRRHRHHRRRPQRRPARARLRLTRALN